MQDQTNTSAASNETVTKDAITGTKVKKQHPIVPTLACKLAIQRIKEEFGLKNDGEAVEAILGALLGGTAPLEGESPEAHGDRMGMLLARLASVESAIQTIEDEREERALQAKEAAREAAAAADRARLAEIKARKAQA
jgi:uncharacterized protein YgbK (DUF1537 family)